MITIKKYNDKLINEWDSFVEKSNNGTIFHKQKFLAYHQHRKYKNCSIIIEYSEQIIALIPGAEIIKNNKKYFHSHPGSSYGGIVTKHNVAFKLINELIIALEQYLKQNGFANIFLINSPKIYYSAPNDSLDYLLQWNKYEQLENYISHAVDLNRTNSINQLLSKRKYRYLQNNKLLQDIKFKKLWGVKDFCEVELFYNILKISKKEYDVKPTHSLNELIVLLKLFSKEIELYITLHDNKIIGGYLIMHANTTASIIFYNVIINKATYKQVAMLQLYHSMKLAKQKKQLYVDFGVSHIPTNTNPLEPKFSLIQFKEQFGAVGVQRTAYYKNLLTGNNPQSLNQ